MSKPGKKDYVVTESQSVTSSFPTSVVIEKETITSESMARIFAENKNLKFFVIQNSKFTPGVMDVVVELGKGLQSFIAEDNVITEDAVKPLVKFINNNNNLITLSLNRSSIGYQRFGDVLNAVGNSASLRFVDLSYTGGKELRTDGDKSLTKFCAGLGASSIERLSLNGVSIDEGSAEALSDSLKENKTLQVLRVGDTNLSISSFQLILKAAVESSSLISINMSAALTPGSTEKDYVVANSAVCKFVKNWEEGKSNITSLGLGCLNLTDDTAKTLSKVVENSGKKLTFLDLSSNNITDEGAIALSRVIGTTLLQSLHLDHNNIGDEGFSSIIKALQGSKIIEILEINGSNISQESVELLVNFVKNSPSLCHAEVTISLAEGVPQEVVASLALQLQPLVTSGKLEITCSDFDDFLGKGKDEIIGSSGSVVTELAALGIAETDTAPKDEASATGGTESVVVVAPTSNTGTPVEVGALGKDGMHD